MIRLSVVNHQIINLRHVCDLFQFLQIIVKKLCLDRFEKDDLISGLVNIGIVGGSKLRIHNDVKYAERVVQNSRPVKVLAKL